MNNDNKGSKLQLKVRRVKGVQTGIQGGGGAPTGGDQRITCAMYCGYATANSCGAASALVSGLTDSKP